MARKTLTISDLTYMWGDEVCIAGVDDSGTCVRPVTPDGVRVHLLFRRGQLQVYPMAKVQFDLAPTETTPPHIEDQRFEPGSTRNEGKCSEAEWEDVLRRTSYPSVADLFDGHFEGGRWVPPEANTRSLGTVTGARIHRNYPYQAAWTQVTHHPRREPS